MSRGNGDRIAQGRIYVGNLPRDIRESELDDLFYQYGRIRSINVKSRAGSPAYAFIEFEESMDAEDAVRGRDGISFDNGRLRVEHLRGNGGRGRDGGREDRGRSTGAQRRGEWRIAVSGIPRSGSWQDLKDHMRSAGNVIYTNVDGHGGGVVEFSSENDMRYALKHLDDMKFVSRTGDTGYIQLRAENEDRDDDRKDRRERSRSPRDRSRSPRRRSVSPRGRDRSPPRERSRDRGDRSPAGNRDRDDGADRERSPRPDERETNGEDKDEGRRDDEERRDDDRVD